jgi:hypothetical protein
MKTTKTLIIAVAVGLFLATTQFSWAANDQGWNDSVYDFGPWNRAVNTAHSGGTASDLGSNDKPEWLENNALADDLVDGTLTPVTALNDFQNGQVIAVYFGGTQNNQAFVSVTANFGSGTWSGIFTGPFDVAVSGSIQGQFFSSDTVAGFRDNTTPVSGMVEGGFFGPDADKIAGAIDITRNGDRIVDVFDGQKVDINLPAN